MVVAPLSGFIRVLWPHSTPPLFDSTPALFALQSQTLNYLQAEVCKDTTRETAPKSLSQTPKSQLTPRLPNLVSVLSEVGCSTILPPWDMW